MFEFEVFNWHLSSFAVFVAAAWWLGLSGLVGWLARAKGRNLIGFLLFALLFSPVIGLLAVIAARDLQTVAEARVADETFRQMLGSLLLQIDGIRGHMAVANDTTRPQMPQVTQSLAPMPRSASAAAKP